MTAENEPRERRRGRTREASTRASALPDQRPFAQPRLRLPPTELLSADQMEAIHQASLRILRDLGMRVLDPETRGIYEAAGATVREQQVTFDPAMVETLIKTAPAEFTLHSWNPAHSLHIGGDWLAFGTVGSAPNSFDLDRGRRTGNRADFQNFCRVAQSLESIHFIGGYPVEPIDVHASVRHLVRRPRRAHADRHAAATCTRSAANAIST